MKRVKAGDSIYSILQQYDFNQNHLSKVLANNPAPRGYKLTPGDLIRVFSNQADKYLELKFYERLSDQSYIFWRRGPVQAGARVQDEDFEIRTQTFTGQINGSLIQSISSHVSDKWVAYRFLDAYAFRFKLPRGLRKGAFFSMVIEKKYDAGDFVYYGEILKTELEIAGQIHKRDFVPFSDGGAFIEPDTFHSDRPLYAPVNYVRISSKFSNLRLHPIKGRRQAHLGVDFELPEGEPVFTAYAGRVLRKGKNRAAGNYVVIRHPNGLESYYNHLQTIDESVKVGSYLPNGELIGTIGCTGYCTKAHLHFAVKRKGRYLNPVEYMKSFPFRKKPKVMQRFARREKTESAS